MRVPRPPTIPPLCERRVCEHRAPSSSVIIMGAGAKKVTFLFLLKYDLCEFEASMVYMVKSKTSQGCTVRSHLQNRIKQQNKTTLLCYS